MHRAFLKSSNERKSACRIGIELYDLDNGPEELNDLSTSKRETTAELLNEIQQKLAEVNEPYQ